jgi:hypothetical protein
LTIVSPVEGEDEAQGGVRGRVLRPEVQGVEELLVRASDVFDGSGGFERHRDLRRVFIRRWTQMNTDLKSDLYSICVICVHLRIKLMYD